MNSINKCLFVAFSSMLACASYAWVDRDDFNLKPAVTTFERCEDIKDPVKRRECFGFK